MMLARCTQSGNTHNLVTILYNSRLGCRFANKYFARWVHSGRQALAATNRITTHYSIIPREDDLRWKGN